MGKIMVIQLVVDLFKVVFLKLLFFCIGQWRKIFDDELIIIRRVFYFLGNYIVVFEIVKEFVKFFVIVDRYWYSMVIYVIVIEVSGGFQYLFLVYYFVYQWLEDLFKFDFILLFIVSFEERLQRLQGWGMEKIREEVEFEVNSVFC